MTQKYNYKYLNQRKDSMTYSELEYAGVLVKYSECTHVEARCMNKVKHEDIPRNITRIMCRVEKCPVEQDLLKEFKREKQTPYQRFKELQMVDVPIEYMYYD